MNWKNRQVKFLADMKEARTDISKVLKVGETLQVHGKASITFEVPDDQVLTAALSLCKLKTGSYYLYDMTYLSRDPFQDCPFLWQEKRRRLNSVLRGTAIPVRRFGKVVYMMSTALTGSVLTIKECVRRIEHAYRAFLIKKILRQKGKLIQTCLLLVLPKSPVLCHRRIPLLVV